MTDRGISCPSCSWRRTAHSQKRAVSLLSAHILLEHSVSPQPRWMQDNARKTLGLDAPTEGDPEARPPRVWWSMTERLLILSGAEYEIVVRDRDPALPGDAVELAAAPAGAERPVSSGGATEQPYERTSGPVHGWFELSYSNYQVLPRVLMQSMPVEWQDRMVACLQEMRDAFRHVEQPEGYEVKPCEWTYVGDLSDGQMKALDITRETEDEDGNEHERAIYYDASGTELEDIHRAPVPVRDTLPHYRHGYVEPSPPAPVPLSNHQGGTDVG